MARVLSVEDVNNLGRTTGQGGRLRTVTSHRLFLAMVSALAGAKVELLADVLRAFSDRTGIHVPYKASYNRLALLGFTVVMRGMWVRLVEHLRVQTLTPEGQRAVAQFKDIVIQLGSSVGLKPSLREVLPGRFTTIEPAAVEIRATFGACWLLADRGCSSVPYFETMEAAVRAYIVRLTSSYDPWVVAARVEGCRAAVPPRMPLSREEASLFFRLPVRLRERGSLIVSHKAFTNWREVFND